MAYHPNNTPPQHIQNMMNDNSYYTEYKEKIIFENEYFIVVDKPDYYALYDNKKTIYWDRGYTIIRGNCSKELVINIAKGLTLLEEQKLL